MARVPADPLHRVQVPGEHGPVERLGPEVVFVRERQAALFHEVSGGRVRVFMCSGWRPQIAWMGGRNVRIEAQSSFFKAPFHAEVVGLHISLPPFLRRGDDRGQQFLLLSIRNPSAIFPLLLCLRELTKSLGLQDKSVFLSPHV